jgi:hypothetical protein
LRAAFESAGQPPAEPEPEITEIEADEPAGFEVEMETQHESEIEASPDIVARAESAPAEAVPAEASELTALVADLEASLGDSFPQAPASGDQLAETHSPVIEPSDAQPSDTQPLPGWPAAAAPKTPEPETEPVANEPAAHIEIEIPAAPADMPSIAAAAGGAATAAAPAMSVPAMNVPAMSYSPAAVRPLGAGAQAMHPSDSVDLSEMFGALKQELEEEVIAGDDDPETHYNLGVAFREMGLLDEAIAELQKVCSSIDRGKAFAQPIQTYTWLAQCFIDKGVPEAAIRWYEKALSIPGLDAEARIAINYELGSACETAMDKPAALRYFTGVYGTNIDYRDVAERIQALKS